MLKAEQELLVQTTNQQLLGIRQAELDYFTSVYDTYAFQAALVAGSVANGFEQVLTQPAIIPRWLKSGYWISAAFSMAFSIHCLSCTSFLSIYGPGFAMRGPVGSMTKAVRGMIQEHHQVFVSYVLTIASFGVNILFCVWSIMYQKEVGPARIITIIAISMSTDFAVLTQIINNYSSVHCIVCRLGFAPVWCLWHFTFGINTVLGLIIASATGTPSMLKKDWQVAVRRKISLVKMVKFAAVGVSLPRVDTDTATDLVGILVTVTACTMEKLPPNRRKTRMRPM